MLHVLQPRLLQTTTPVEYGDEFCLLFQKRREDGINAIGDVRITSVIGMDFVDHILAIIPHARKDIADMEHSHILVLHLPIAKAPTCTISIV